MSSHRTVQKLVEHNVVHDKLVFLLFDFLNDVASLRGALHESRTNLYRHRRNVFIRKSAL